MARFDDHAYKMAVFGAMRDEFARGLRERRISLEDGRVVTDLLQEAVTRDLSPPDVRKIVQKLAAAWPIFQTVPLHPSYLDDERGTLDTLYDRIAEKLVPDTPEIRAAVNARIEKRDFIRVFPSPVTVNADDEGLFVLYNRGSIQARDLECELKKQGWVLDEPIEAHDLMKAGRVRITERSKRYWTGDAVTVRFRR